MTPSQTTAAASPVSPADPGWDEAFLRVESYLRAHGLESRVLLNQFAAEILQEAQSGALADGGGEPVTLAMATAHARIGAWVARTGSDADWTNERERTRGRLALITADLPGSWSNYFLSPDPVPAELARAMAACEVLPCPELHFSHMSPAPLELEIPESRDPHLPPRKIWLPVRIVALWLLIGGFFGIAWAVSH